MTAQLTATFSSGTLLSAESPRIACNSDDISNMDGCADEGDGGRHHAAAQRDAWVIAPRDMSCRAVRTRKAFQASGLEFPERPPVLRLEFNNRSADQKGFQ